MLQVFVLAFMMAGDPTVYYLGPRGGSEPYQFQNNLQCQEKLEEVVDLASKDGLKRDKDYLIACVEKEVKKA